MAQDRRQADTGRVPSPGQAVQQALDPVRARRPASPPAPADPARGAQAVGHRLAVEELAVAGRRLDGVPERVAQVQGDPSARRFVFALVGRARPPPSPRRSVRRPRRRTRPEGVGRSPRAIAAPSASSSSNSRSSPRAAILTASPRAARRWRSGSVRSDGDVDDDRRGLVECADEVLALRQVHAGLAADRRVDLGDEGRRDVDERDAAQVRGGDEPGGIAERAATDGDDRLATLHPQPGEVAGGHPPRPPAAWPPRPAGGGSPRPCQPPAAAPMRQTPRRRQPRPPVRTPGSPGEPPVAQRGRDAGRGDAVADQRSARSASPRGAAWSRRPAPVPASVLDGPHDVRAPRRRR